MNDSLTRFLKLFFTTIICLLYILWSVLVPTMYSAFVVVMGYVGYSLVIDAVSYSWWTLIPVVPFLFGVMTGVLVCIKVVYDYTKWCVNSVKDIIKDIKSLTKV